MRFRGWVDGEVDRADPRDLEAEARTEDEVE